MWQNSREMKIKSEKAQNKEAHKRLYNQHDNRELKIKEKHEKTLERVLFLRIFFTLWIHVKSSSERHQSFKKFQRRKPTQWIETIWKCSWRSLGAKLNQEHRANLEFLAFLQALCNHIWYPFLFKLFPDFFWNLNMVLLQSALEMILEKKFLIQFTQDNSM